MADQPAAGGIPVEDVARLPSPGQGIPTALAFSSDGRHLAFLASHDGSLTRRLCILELESGVQVSLAPPATGVSEEDLSLEEKLRRERARDIGLGVTSYQWAKQGHRLLLPLPDGLYVQDARSGAGADLRMVAGAGAGPIIDPKFSPDGSQIGFVQGAEIHIVEADGSGPPRALTSGAVAGGVTHGLAEFIAQEEMGRSSGWWWSDDGKWVAFCEVGESHIPPFRIMHQGSEKVGDGAEEQHRYPFAGAANARVSLAVVPSDGSAPPRWLDLGEDAEYLARVSWAPDGTLLAQVEDRSQRRLVVYRYDVATGARSAVLIDSSDVWINLHDGLRQLDDGRVLWLSERSGFRHIYLDGAPVTSGRWQVDAIEAADLDRQLIWFTGTLDGAVERHLYEVPFAGGPPRRLTSEPGTHAVVVDETHRRFADTWSALDQPPVVRVRSLDDGAVLLDVWSDRDPRIDRLALRPPEPVTIVNRDGVELYGAFYRPAGAPPWPTIVQVYGGPHAQLVTNSWAPTVYMRAQLLRSRGFAVFVLDNRGSARRGVAFEGAVAGDLGNLEVADQVDGVRWLVTQGVTDPRRVGIYGWSYGGYLAAMALCRAPDTFAAAVAGAPVTAWDGYDTHYTERYMGLPQEETEGYARSQVMAHVESMRGRLMIVHGLIDENVHFRHTARLINALIAARRPYELLLFPDERHSPRRLEDRVFMEEQIAGFFARALW